jgi:hypothetical protein
MKNLNVLQDRWQPTITREQELQWEKNRRKISQAVVDTKNLVGTVRYVIENFLWIRTKENTLIRLQLNRTQRFVLEIIEYLWLHSVPVRIIILKARQEGISTLIEAILFVLTIMISNTRSNIISYNKKSVINIYRMSDRFYMHLPESIRPKTKYYTKESMYFEDPDPRYSLDSEILIDLAKNVKAGRSETINNVHVSEVALMEEVIELVTSLLGSMPKFKPLTFVALESTAYGTGNYFHQEWKKSIPWKKARGIIERGDKNELFGKNIGIFIPWFWHEEYKLKPPKTYVLNTDIKVYGDEKKYKKAYNLSMAQMYWRKLVIESQECNWDIEKFQQEYPSNDTEAFLAAGRCVFNTKIIDEMIDETKDPIAVGELKLIKDMDIKKPRIWPIIEFVENPTGYLSIWEFPKKFKLIRDARTGEVIRKDMISYRIGSDVAEGKIITENKTDYSTAEVLRQDTMKVVARIKVKVDPDVFADYLYMLGYWYNFAGLGVEKNNHGTVVVRNLQRRYGMLYFRLILNEKNDKKSKEYGWYTGPTERPIMIDDLVRLIRQRGINIPSKETLEEMLSFIHHPSGKIKAENGAWDDEVIGLCVMYQMHLLMPYIDHFKREKISDKPKAYSMSYQKVGKN